jgi:hypothetical protein
MSGREPSRVSSTPTPHATISQASLASSTRGLPLTNVMAMLTTMTANANAAKVSSFRLTASPSTTRTTGATALASRATTGSAPRVRRA